MSRDEVLKQKRNLPLLVTREACSGKTYIVTGANVGLGLEAARHLAAVGAGKVILAVRNAGAGAAAKADIDATTGVAPNVVEVWSLDLSSYASVKAFAKRAEAELERIDGLIENAAIAPSKRELAEGHVLAMTVNVLSTFLLAVLMIPVMKEKAAKVGGEMPTISIVASRVSFDYKEAWDKIKDDPIVGMDDEGFETLITFVRRSDSLPAASS
jgi:NAD(P)-dependent dehydrogenase (short-subunit alcohol dehydrogenase family)